MKKRELGQLGHLCASALLSASLLLGGCGPQGESAKPASGAQSAGAASASAAAPVSRDFVIVGVDTQSTPMAFWDSQTRAIVGYDVDMAKEALKRAGLKHEFEAIDWSRKEKDLLQDKKIDLIWSSMSVTEERKRIFAFSNPYIKNQQAILVRADSPIQGKGDLGGKKVAVNKGSIGASLVKRLSGAEAPAKVEEFDVRIDIFSAVLSGQADAAVTDGVVANYYSVNSPGKFRVLKDSLQEEDLAVAVRPADTELLEKINKALADMQADGSAQAIQQRWFGGSQ
ncbi:MAG: transporter substrate-binding domain-containing protein [Brachymonas sp.]|nr:transporter substrate-binding domain-containing protein [Brachymonas sp.]